MDILSKLQNFLHVPLETVAKQFCFQYVHKGHFSSVFSSKLFLLINSIDILSIAPNVARV